MAHDTSKGKCDGLLKLDLVLYDFHNGQLHTNMKKEVSNICKIHLLRVIEGQQTFYNHEQTPSKRWQMPNDNFLSVKKLVY